VSAEQATNAAVIDIRGLTKRFRTYRSNKRRVLSWITAGRLGGGRWVDALRELDLTVRRGESLAVVGANGAGKSTLLKLISGTLYPTSGAVETNGRVGALLELGMGFHPEFTGRENVRLNGLLLGMTRSDLRESMSAIVDFSELGPFIDEPIRTYSSGMILRLGYSVAVFMKPAILAIDEALAVGDAAFQQKCYDHMRGFLHDGGTLVFVSHEPQAVLRICERAMLLEHGRKVCEGTPASVLQEYSARMAGGGAGSGGSVRFATRGAGLRGGQFRAMIESVEMRTPAGATPSTFVTGSDVVCTVRGVVIYPVEDLTVGVLIRDRTGSDVYGTNSAELGVKVPVAEGGRFEARFGFSLNLGPGQYTISAALHAGVQHLAGSYDWADQIGGFEVAPDPTRRFTGSVWLPTTLDVADTEPARGEDLATLWQDVLADAPPRIMPSDESARFLLGGVEKARSVAGGQENAGKGAQVGGELIAALRLAGERVSVELTNDSARARTAVAFIASTCLGDAELAPGRHAVEFEVPAPWRGKVALLRVHWGEGSLVCHGISCE
jgi:lipopolysaccharide transport system ATP-binding protein